MRHKFLVLTVKKWLKSVNIYGRYRKIKTGVSLFWTTLYMNNYYWFFYLLTYSNKFRQWRTRGQDGWSPQAAFLEGGTVKQIWGS